jgi:hypothetical protein
MRVELRDIEIFLVLAEELHFGRTAERLHVSRARVSQAIKKQERRIGAPLFDRTSRTVTLTPIGQRLRDDLQQAYDLVQSGLGARPPPPSVFTAPCGLVPWECRATRCSPSSAPSGPATPIATSRSPSSISAIPSPGCAPARSTCN